MIIRAVIKYFRKRITRLNVEIGMMIPYEERALLELFTKRNYTPNDGVKVFKSFNTEFRDWIFSLKAFCKAY